MNFYTHKVNEGVHYIPSTSGAYRKSGKTETFYHDCLAYLSNGTSMHNSTPYSMANANLSSTNYIVPSSTTNDSTKRLNYPGSVVTPLTLIQRNASSSNLGMRSSRWTSTAKLIPTFSTNY